MPLSYRKCTVNHHIIGVVDDSVNNGIRDRTVIVRIGIDAFILALGMVLCTENHRPINTHFDDLQQIIAFICRQLANQSFVKNQKVNLPVRFDHL